MITLLHGENIVASRQELVKILAEAVEKGREIDRVEAKGLTLGSLQEKLIRRDLFGTERVVIIEGLHSLPRSKNKTQLIEQLATAETDVILWEKRDLTKTMLKQFAQAEIKHFKLSKSLFKWLESLSGSKKTKQQQVKLFHQALEQEDPYLCFIMLARQLRLLIQTSESGSASGPPWMAKKLEKQAKTFKLKKLLQIHRQLLEIDLKHKTSKNTLEVEQELDLLLLAM